MFFEMREELNRLGVVAITNLQTTFPKGDSFFLGVTQLADPLYSFTILFPMAAAIHTGLAADVLAVTLVAEWANTMLKWLLMEGRPYWWVRETAIYGGLASDLAPVLRQTHLTCETGPGCPSGHVMGAGAVSMVLVYWFLRCYVHDNARLGDGAKQLVTRLVWAAYVVMLLLVSLSRMYVATHFPHQCVLGAAAGVAVTQLLAAPGAPYSARWRSALRPRALLSCFLLALSCVAAYWIQKALGIDPQWSVRLAFKWCSSPDFLHVNTTPLFSLVRVCGAATGLALAAPLAPRYARRHNRVVGTVLSMCLAVAFQMATDAVPKGDVRAFYACQFMLHAVEPYLLLVAVPYIAGSSSDPNRKQD